MDNVMDIFNQQPFQAVAMTNAIQKTDYVPNLLGSLNIFRPDPVLSDEIMMDIEDHSIKIIPTSERGSSPEQAQRRSRAVKMLKATRLAKSFTIYASEVFKLRQTGTSLLTSVQREYAKRMGDLRADLELTEEHHRLGALQGVLLDADGTTVIYDFYDEFNVTKPAVINFTLDNAATEVKLKCSEVKRNMIRAGRGAITPTTTIYALVGDDFWDKLTTHPTVEKYYLNHSEAKQVAGLGIFETFTFGGITFINYQGTDDNSTVAIAPDKAHFFPINARGVFEKAQAPAEFEPFVTQPGQSVYMLNLPDPSGRNAFRKGEIFAYPLFYCAKPEVLQEGVAN